MDGSSTANDAANDEPTGSRGAAIGVGGLTVFGFAMLPALIVVFLYIAITVYAIVKAIGSAPQEPSAITMYLMLIGVVTFLTLAVAGGVYMIGRSSEPKRRH